MKIIHSTKAKVSPIKPCIQCGKFFSKPYNESVKNWTHRHKFCSKECNGRWCGLNLEGIKATQFPKGYVSTHGFKKGVRSNPAGEFTSESTTDEKHWAWKGDQVGYHALHNWIARKMGKASRCDVCGCDEMPSGKKRWFDWANVSHEYKRDLSDWMMMCKPCHRLYDRGTLILN